MKDFAVCAGGPPPGNSWFPIPKPRSPAISQVLKPGSMLEFPGGGPSRISSSAQVAHLLEIPGYLKKPEESTCFT